VVPFSASCWEASRASDQEDVMMENGKRQARPQLSPEQWEMFLEVTSQADAARKWGVDVSVIVRLRALAKDAALAAFASSKPGRVPSPSRWSWRPRWRRTTGSRRRSRRWQSS
jgi:hypothetical protein